jgi:hypothetical protein
MHFFIDAEFHEDGKIIDLISLALVTRTGDSYYAINSEFDYEYASKNKWLKENVLKHIDMTAKNVKTKKQIKKEVLEFIGKDDDIKFIGDYCSYDWVVFCQIFGKMIDLPEYFPMYCNDLQQLKACCGVTDETLPKLDKINHHALEDAKELLIQWKFLEKIFESKFGKKYVL